MRSLAKKMSVNIADIINFQSIVTFDPYFDPCSLS